MKNIPLLFILFSFSIFIFSQDVPIPADTNHHLIVLNDADNQDSTIIDNNKIFAEDKRIIVTVDSLKRIDYSNAGDDYVIIYVNVFEKIDLHIGVMQMEAKHRLIDDSGKIYYLSQAFSDFLSPAERKDHLEFIIPKYVIPVNLRYYYQYRDVTPKKRKNKIKFGQIDIDLLQNGLHWIIKKR